MNICLIGFDYSSSENLREKTVLTESKKFNLINILGNCGKVCEFVILSTCNRLEIYYVANDVASAKTIVLSSVSDVIEESIEDFYYFLQDFDAVFHLFCVASGFNSQLLGEDQILGQVKDAFYYAINKKTSGKILNRMFLHAITEAKKIKTRFGSLCVNISISFLAVRETEELFKQADKINVLVIGAGKIGELTLKYLKEIDKINLTLTNRTRKTAEENSVDYSGDIKIIDYGKRYSLLSDMDVVITATSSPHYTIKHDDFQCYKPLVIIDLAVPRDVDPKVAALPNVKYINMDYLINNQNEKNKIKLDKINEAKKLLKISAKNTYSVLNSRD